MFYDENILNELDGVFEASEASNHSEEERPRKRTRKSTRKTSKKKKKPEKSENMMMNKSLFDFFDDKNYDICNYVNDDEFLSFMDKQNRGSVVDHLDTCAICNRFKSEKISFLDNRNGGNLERSVEVFYVRISDGHIEKMEELLFKGFQSGNILDSCIKMTNYWNHSVVSETNKKIEFSSYYDPERETEILQNLSMNRKILYKKIPELDTAKIFEHYIQYNESPISKLYKQSRMLEVIKNELYHNGGIVKEHKNEKDIRNGQKKRKLNTDKIKTMCVICKTQNDTEKMKSDIITNILNPKTGGNVTSKSKGKPANVVSK